MVIRSCSLGVLGSCRKGKPFEKMGHKTIGPYSEKIGKAASCRNKIHFVFVPVLSFQNGLIFCDTKYIINVVRGFV